MQPWCEQALKVRVQRYSQFPKKSRSDRRVSDVFIPIELARVGQYGFVELLILLYIVLQGIRNIFCGVFVDVILKCSEGSGFVPKHLEVLRSKRRSKLSF